MVKIASSLMASRDGLLQRFAVIAILANERGCIKYVLAGGTRVIFFQRVLGLLIAGGARRAAVH